MAKLSNKTGKSKLRVKEYFLSETEKMLKAFRDFEKLLPSQGKKGSIHPPEEGRFIESILRNYLRKFLPKNIGVFSGFIIDNSNKNSIKSSSQIDILLYDVANFPIYEKFQEFVIVPPEGVLGIISVKKTLQNRLIKSECQALLSNLEICNNDKRRNPMTALFAFTMQPKAKPNSIVKQSVNSLVSSTAPYKFDNSVYYITVLDSFTIYKKSPEDFINYKTQKNVQYEFVDFTDENSMQNDIGLQALINATLSVYYERINNIIPRPFFNQIELIMED